ncbi:hypothetical protein ACQPZJ_26640 [Actinoplanes sp. CA-054009]
MDAIREMYARCAAADLGADDQWGDVTADPRGVDHTEVSAGGAPAMWLSPHGAGRDRVIVAVHADLRGLPPVYIQRGGYERMAA